jgi:predicted phosphodiesterase
MDPLPILPFKRGDKAEAEMAAVLQLSDWHVGERISRNETGGFGEYNWSIAQERAEYITDKFIGWLKSKQTLFNIPAVHILGLADWVSGDIHRELVSTNEFALPEQAVKSGELLARVVGKIAPHVPSIVLTEIEPDNHGRLNPKPQFKQKATNNMSFVTYAVANALLAKHGNIEIINNHRIRELVNVGGQKILCEHGDVVRSWQGVPYMGMMRHAGREANKHMRAILEQQRRELRRMKQEYGFDYVALGHFHVPNIIDNQIIVNGSLSGTSEFDEGVGRYAKPSQVSYVMHPKYGYFDFTPWTTKI